MKRYIVPLCALLAFATEANASSIIYRGINPEITPTANPLNENAIANFYNISKPAAPTTNSQLTESQLLKQSIISGLSTVYQQLLTANGNQTGTLNLGDGSIINYYTANGMRYITFIDPSGQQTTISFPIS